MQPFRIRARKGESNPKSRFENARDEMGKIESIQQSEKMANKHSFRCAAFFAPGRVWRGGEAFGIAFVSSQCPLHLSLDLTIYDIIIWLFMDRVWIRTNCQMPKANAF